MPIAVWIHEEVDELPWNASGVAVGFGYLVKKEKVKIMITR